LNETFPPLPPIRPNGLRPHMSFKRLLLLKRKEEKSEFKKRKKSYNQPTNQPTNQELTLSEAHKKLTRAQSRVLDRLARSNGEPNREIAKDLHINPKSLENYITRIGKELDLQGPGNLKRWASKQNQEPDVET
jgi:DNA-binding NarL/FixJ family response regulator